jgi:hypothetical protein
MLAAGFVRFEELGIVVVVLDVFIRARRVRRSESAQAEVPPLIGHVAGTDLCVCRAKRADHGQGGPGKRQRPPAGFLVVRTGIRFRLMVGLCG